MGRSHHCELGLYERANVIYFSSQEEDKYDVNIFQLPTDLLYKDIPLTLYVETENVMDKKNVFIAWDRNGTSVKYLPCVFEGVYVLDVSNLLCKGVDNHCSWLCEFHNKSSHLRKRLSSKNTI